MTQNATSSARRRAGSCRRRHRTIPVDDLCAVLEVSRSGYSTWQARPPPAQTKPNEQLGVEIAAIVSSIEFEWRSRTAAIAAW
jgi:hypothetical protein